MKITTAENYREDNSNPVSSLVFDEIISLCIFILFSCQ